MKKIVIPSKAFFNKAEKIISGIINQQPLYQDYYHINDIITDDTPELQKLILKQTELDKFKISAGTSDYVMYKAYKDKIIADFKNNSYYRNYNNPPGNNEARFALAEVENAKFDNELIYTYKDFSLAEGSTGAISEIFEYIKRSFQVPEIIIGTPTYYLYKYLAKFFKISYQEAFSIESVREKTVFFNPIQDILAKLSKKTKLVVIVQPNNPTNQIYVIKDVKRLLNECKKRKILLLVDELFSELIFASYQFTPTDILAEKIGCLNNLVIVKGYSKSKNLAGLRIGYLFSINKKLIEGVNQISEQRQCFAGSSNYSGLIALDSFVQSVKSKAQKNPNISEILRKTKKIFSKFSPTIANLKIVKLKKIYVCYIDYLTKLKKYYGEYCKEAYEILEDEIIQFVPKIVAYNTIVKIKGIDNVNFFDFCLNFYLCCNVVTQIGPCFAFDQNRWQRDKNLGFWLRLSYSRKNKKQFMDSLKLLIQFKKIYLNSPEKFLKTNLTF